MAWGTLPYITVLAAIPSLFTPCARRAIPVASNLEQSGLERYGRNPEGRVDYLARTAWDASPS